IKSGQDIAPYNSFMVFTRNANPQLPQPLLKHFHISFPHPTLSKFSHPQIPLQFIQNLPPPHLFILHPTSPPTNHNLIEILTMGDALNRASPAPITPAIPC
ncbi:ribose-phosphate pyrophosphokinase-like domain-containing protein, partial [Neisseria sicca]|uniref:ribose-phosphate pyrophosphokinase-like domain-containing protein n=1 Tax=Neisseria sicca TaxID=490 RepID=UPI001649CF29